MPSLFHTLNMGAESLYATRQGVDTAGHNIANAQVEGYSRQQLNVTNREPIYSRGHLFGNGVMIKGVQRAHNQFIDDQINKSNQDSGRSMARFESLRDVEGIFSPELASNLSDEMGNFFNSLQDLSNFPEDYTVRSNVLESGRNLTSAFRTVDLKLKDQRDGLNDRILQTVADVNDKLQGIAKLNIRIQELEAGETVSANDLRDQRDLLLKDVSKNIEINYYEDQWGMVMLRGPNQVTLVDGSHAAQLGVAGSAENGGFYDVTITDWEGVSNRNVTDSIKGGSLQGFLELRDQLLPDLIEKNNVLAHNFATEFNSLHQQGFGIDEFAETQSRNFFAMSDDLSQAASSIRLDDLIGSSPNAIAAGSTPGAPGDNVVVNDMLRLREQATMNGGSTTFTEYYANMVGKLGLEVVRAEHIKDADHILSVDLDKKREAISGVSLDEEAINLMRWQSNFTASSKVITTVDEMLETLLSIKR